MDGAVEPQSSGSLSLLLNLAPGKHAYRLSDLVLQCGGGNASSAFRARLEPNIHVISNLAPFHIHQDHALYIWTILGTSTLTWNGSGSARVIQLTHRSRKSWLCWSISSKA